MESDNKLKNRGVETYTEDMVKVIEGGEGGIIKKIIDEQEEHEVQKKNLSPESLRNKMFMLWGVALLFLASMAIVSFFIFREKIFTLSVAPQFVPIIFTDQNRFLEVAGQIKEDILKNIFNEANASKVKMGGIEGIYLTERTKVLGFPRLLKLLKSELDLGQNSFLKDNFLLGVFKDEVNHIFFLLQTRSFSDVFPIMRDWENKMFLDLHGFLGMDLSPDTNYLLTKNFENRVVQNKNARILYGQDGEIALMYVFLDENSVIITNSQRAVEEVISRLLSSRIRK